MTSLEFRAPISPQPGFYAQCRLFRFALDRLGGRYEEALLTIVVGDDADIDRVIEANSWADRRRVRFIGVPRDIFAEFGIHGTADYRYVPEPCADAVILSDADTLLVAPIDDLLARMNFADAELYGHMAHYPPPNAAAQLTLACADGAFWGPLLAHFEIDPVDARHSYSMDAEGALGLAPPYFNLGFLALTPQALRIFGEQVFPVQRELLRVLPNHMRCQLAVTLIGLKHLDRMEAISAAYNLANDDAHLRANAIAADAARVIHYLREAEFTRSTFLLPERIGETLVREYQNPVTRRLMAVTREFQTACARGAA